MTDLEIKGGPFDGEIISFFDAFSFDWTICCVRRKICAYHILARLNNSEPLHYVFCNYVKFPGPFKV